MSDSLETDVARAKAASIRSIRLNCNGWERDADVEADWEMRSLRRLSQIVL